MVQHLLARCVLFMTASAPFVAVQSQMIKRNNASSASASSSFASFSSSSSSTTLLNGTDGDPGVYPGSYNGGSKGWTFMPDITDIAGSTLDTTSLTVGSGSILTHYITSNFTPSSIKRAVVLIHGQDRPSWNMQIYGNLALQRAVTGGDVKAEEVVIMSPQFFISIDEGAYPVTSTGKASSDQMVWSSQQGGWGQGDKVVDPSSSTVGSFEALDAILNLFHDKTTYPALEYVVLAGFSMGAQLVQRYSVFNPDTSEDDRTKYWISSPASFVYLNDSRPASSSAVEKCNSYNSYKYGLNGTLPAYLDDGVGKLTLDEMGLQTRFIARSLNFFVGVEDDLASDHSCSANLQGDSHLVKMYNWVKYVMPYLGGGTGNLPSNSTIDYVEKASHDPWLIINSDPGIQRLFLDDYNGPGQDAAAPSSNGYTSGTPTASQLKAHADEAFRTLPSSFILMAATLVAGTASISFA